MALIYDLLTSVIKKTFNVSEFGTPKAKTTSENINGDGANL